MIAQLLRLMVPGTVHQADNFQSANWIDDYNPCTWEGEVGQQACGIRRTNDDLPTVTAVVIGPNNEILPESTLTYMTAPTDFEFPLELEAQLIMFYPPCDSPPGTYKIVVSDEQHELVLWGQILFYGYFEKEAIIIERLRRFSLFGRPVELESDDARARTLSLAGPRNLQNPELLEPGSGLLFDLILQLHYTALSDYYGPRYESEDAVFPPLERVQTQLIWNQEEDAESLAITFALSETIIERDEQDSDLIATLDIPDFTVRFRQSNPEPVVAKNMSLFMSTMPQMAIASRCTLTPCNADFDTIQHTLYVHFVNLSPLFHAGNMDVLVDICNKQLEAACHILGIHHFPVHQDPLWIQETQTQQ